MAALPAPLFDPDVPLGFRYRRDWITPAEETDLLNHLLHLEFANFELRGVVARRRVAFFGRSYLEHGAPEAPMPAFLLPLRDRVAAWAGVTRDEVIMALINEYRPGAPIGWHRDAPQYGVVAGISLRSACRIKFRPYLPPRATRAAANPPRRATHELLLERRSAYLMTGESRNAFEHHIPPVGELRYSITFRTSRV